VDRSKGRVISRDFAINQAAAPLGAAVLHAFGEFKQTRGVAPADGDALVQFPKKIVNGFRHCAYF
jgi:hypothetical protein